MFLKLKQRKIMMNDVKIGQCFIWTDTQADWDRRYELRTTFVNSPRTGGKYEITDEAVKNLYDKDTVFRLKLTTWLAEQRLLMNITTPQITGSVLGNITRRGRLPLNEQTNLLLKYLYEKAGSKIGGKVEVRIMDKFEKIMYDQPNENISEKRDGWLPSISVDYVCAYSETEDAGEADNMLIMLSKKGWLQYEDLERNYICELTFEGIERIAPIENQNIESNQAFVAMWFDPDMDKIYENAIAPAIEESGYKPMRIDKKNHNNKIDDEIVAEIKRSKFLIADFSQNGEEARGGVYYEAGFAKGLGIEVIFTCRKENEKNLHFDTRQYNHIIWESEKDLKTQLENRIGATVGDGPLKGNVEA